MSSRSKRNESRARGGEGAQNGLSDEQERTWASFVDVMTLSLDGEGAEGVDQQSLRAGIVWGVMLADSDIEISRRIIGPLTAGEAGELPAAAARADQLAATLRAGWEEILRRARPPAPRPPDSPD